MVASSQVRAQAEDLDLLGALRAGAQQPQVVQLAPLRRPAVQHRVRQGGEVGLAEKGRNHRRDQQHHQPGREHDQPGGERDQAEGVLAQVEHGSQQAQPPGGLAARPLQLVVKDRVLERGQIQRGGVLASAAR